MSDNITPTNASPNTLLCTYHKNRTAPFTHVTKFQHYKGNTNSSNPNRSRQIQTHWIALITCQRNNDTIRPRSRHDNIHKIGWRHQQHVWPTSTNKLDTVNKGAAAKCPLKTPLSTYHLGRPCLTNSNTDQSQMQANSNPRPAKTLRSTNYKTTTKLRIKIPKQQTPKPIQSSLQCYQESSHTFFLFSPSAFNFPPFSLLSFDPRPSDMRLNCGQALDDTSSACLQFPGLILPPFSFSMGVCASHIMGVASRHSASWGQGRGKGLATQAPY